MFVDDKKVGEAQIDTRSDLERFIAWAKTQNPREIYDYSKPDDCLIARWDKSEGRDRMLKAAEVEQLFGGCGKKIAQYSTGYGSHPRTVGGALAAALKIQGEK